MSKVTGQQIQEIVNLRMEVHRATARMQTAFRRGEQVNPEDLVVARGSLEQLIEMVAPEEQE